MVRIDQGLRVLLERQLGQYHIFPLDIEFVFHLSSSMLLYK